MPSTSIQGFLIHSGTTNLAIALIKRGANVNAQNTTGDTTLHYTYNGNSSNFV